MANSFGEGCLKSRRARHKKLPSLAHTVAPDYAKLTIGGPKPLPQAELGWLKENKTAIHR